MSAVHYPHQERIDWFIKNLVPFHSSISLRSIRSLCTSLCRDTIIPALNVSTPMIDILDACENAGLRVSREEGGQEAVWARLEVETVCEIMVAIMYYGYEKETPANVLKRAVKSWTKDLGYNVIIPSNHIPHYRRLEDSPIFEVSPRLNMDLQRQAAEYLAADLRRIRVSAFLECIQGDKP